MAAPRIMIVEDERVVAGQLASSLEDLGYEIVAIVASGEEAVQEAEAIRPELILMDIMLEGEMDGIEAAGLIRSRFDLPVVYITAYSQESLLERAKATHPAGYLVKPVRGDELRANVELALVKGELERRLAEGEKRYRAVVESQTELICRYRPDGTFTFANHAYLRYFGKEPDALIGRKFALSVLEEDRTEVAEHFAVLGPENPVRSHEIRIAVADGEVRWLRWTDRGLFDEHGNLTEIQGVGQDVTDRKRIEHDLEASRATFSSIVETSRDAIMVVKGGGVIAYANQAAAMFLNRPQEELVGSQFGHPICPVDTGEIEVVLEGGLAGVAEMRVEQTDWHGKRAWLVKLHDVTDRKRAEDEAERRREVLSAINRIFRDTLQSENDHHVAAVCLSEVEKITGSPFGWIGEVNDSDGLEMIARSETGWSECTIPECDVLRKTERMRIRGICALALEKGESQIVNNPSLHPASVGIPKDHPPIYSFLGVPLKRSGKTFGMIALANKPGGYNSRDVEHVEALSFSFAEALYRRRAQQRLTESEERYRTLFNDSKDGVYETGRRGQIINANQSFLDILGYSRDEMIEMDAIRLYADPADRGRFVQSIEKAGFVKNYPIRIRKKDGTVGECELSSTLRLDNEANVIGYGGIVRDVTAQRGAERALRESRHMLQAILDSIPIRVFWKDRNFVYLGCNRTFAEDAGLASPADVVGKTDHDLPWTKEEATWYRRCDKRVIDSSSPTYHILETQTQANGNVAWLDTNKVPLRDAEGMVVGILGAYEDITNRKRMLDELKKSEERFRLLSEASPVGISIIQDDRRVYANPALVLMFGYESDQEMLHLRLKDMWPPDSLNLVETLISEAGRKSRPIAHHKLQGVRKDGRHFDASIWLVGTEFRSKPAVLTFVIDDSETKSLQAQLLRAQKMESLGSVAGGIAHDFNNLLMVIQGYSELLLLNREEGDPDREELEAINETAHRGSDLVRRILTFSRQIDSEFRPVDLNHELEQAYKLLRWTIPKMVGVRLHLADNLKQIKADPGQIEQVLMNLAVNATHAMPDGGTLTVETKSAYLDKEYCRTHVDAKAGECVLFRVSDTGCGIEKDVVDHIFEPFFTTKKHGEGTGLGLAMVFGIVKSHGGYITCYSEPGVGTTFEIYFPVLEDKERNHFEEKTAEEPAEFGTETVLLVDDEEWMRDLGTRMLGEAGYEVLTAENGKEALKAYRTGNERISLVILDLIMPEMGGKECLEEILKLDPDAKVIVSSGFPPNGTTQQVVEARAKGFVGKPFKRIEMLRTIRRVLDAAATD